MTSCARTAQAPGATHPLPLQIWPPSKLIMRFTIKARNWGCNGVWENEMETTI